MFAFDRAQRSCLNFGFSAAFIVSGYEFVRSSSNSLFKYYYGIENLPIALAFMPIFVMGILSLYGKILTAFGPKKTFEVSLLGSSLLIALAYILLSYKIKWASVFLLYFREAYVVLLIEQCWSFVNSVLNKKQAKELNGVILAISTIGAVLGGLLVFQLSTKISTHKIILGPCLLCIPSLFFFRRACHHFNNFTGLREKNTYCKDNYGLWMFKKYPVLVLIFLIIMFSQIYNTVVSLTFQRYLQEAYPNIDQQTSISGLYFSFLNFFSLFMQLIVVPLCLRSLSLAVIHMLIPSVHVLSIFLFFFYPSFISAGVVLLLFKAFDYSLFRAAKEILYIPLPFDARFRSKEFIDVLVYRSSKGCGSLMISSLSNFSLLSTQLIAMAGFLPALAWLASILLFYLRDISDFRFRTP